MPTKSAGTKRKAKGAVRERFTNTAAGNPVGAVKLREAAKFLGGISTPTMHRLIREGRLRPCRQLRHYLFDLRELQRFLEEGQTD